jgi:glycosyltransferase involved in cell wall biosynthesis
MTAPVCPPVRLLAIVDQSDRSESALFQRLARSGYEVDLFCNPLDQRQDEMRQGGIRVQTLKVRHRFDLHAAGVVRRKLLAGNHDILYATSNRGLAAAVIASRGLPVKLAAYRGTLGNLSRLNPGCHVAHLNPRISSIICNCEAVRRYLIDFGFAPEKLAAIYKGHDTAWYRSQDCAAPEELGIPADAFVVGCCANVRPLKGIDVLVRAAARLADIPLHLLIVGQVRDQRCQRLARRLGIQERVHFTGFRSDAARIMRLCRVAVMPSLRREGLPRAIVETMSQGIPAIVTDVGGMPELVSHKRTGLVVPPGNAEALAQAIMRLYREPQLTAAFGEESAKWIAERFSVAGSLAAFQSLFRRLAAEKRGAPFGRSDQESLP